MGPGEWLRWSAYPFGGGVCRGQAGYPALLPDLQMTVGFLDFLRLVHNLPELCMHTAILSAHTHTHRAPNYKIILQFFNALMSQLDLLLNDRFQIIRPVVSPGILSLEQAVDADVAGPGPHLA